MWAGLIPAPDILFVPSLLAASDTVAWVFIVPIAMATRSS
jgi:hypothetical protein